MNPDIDLTTVGATIMVAVTRTDPIEGVVARIEVDSAAAALRAFAADGRLLATYPTTVGSADFPSPSGTMEVRAVAAAPAHYFSPDGSTRTKQPHFVNASDENIEKTLGP